MFATTGGAQFLDASDFLPEADTTGTMNTARHIGLDQWPDILVFHRTFALCKPADTLTIAHRQILQFTFPSLITNRAIKWVIDQQKLHHTTLRMDRHFRTGKHFHAFRDRCGAGRQGFSGLVYLDQTHTTVGRYR